MLAVRPWENYLTFLNLNFFHMKIGGVEELKELNNIRVVCIL